MDVLRLWKDSLRVFKPENLKLFGLVTLNAYRQFWQVILANWALMLGVFVVLFTLMIVSPLSFILFSSPSFFIFSWVMHFLVRLRVNCCIFIFVLATRASIKRKKFEYFFEYVKRFWYFIVAYTLLDLLVYTGFQYIASLVPLSLAFAYALWLIIKVIFLLFVLDANHIHNFILKSLRNTVFFMLANAPICLLLSGLILGEFWLFRWLVPMVNVYWTWTLVVARILPLSLLVVILTNLYIKHTHDNAKDYFPQPS